MGPLGRRKVNLDNTDLRVKVVVLTGFIWLRIRSSGGWCTE
jgi:hypothetical protein